MAGHSDAMMVVVACRTETLFTTVKTCAYHMGHNAAPDDVYLAQRGLRTMAVRLRRHGESALKLARWLQGRPEVERVLYPALPEDPGHAIWQRDFSGASGLFSVVLKPVPTPSLAAIIDGMELLGMGYRWGGSARLFIPATPA